MFRRALIIALVSTTAYASALAQGCSDAGFCTMGAMKPDQAYSRKINFKLRSIELSQYRGTTTLSPLVYVANLDVSLGLTEKTGVQVKLPYQWTTGNFGNSSGMGDISLSITHNFRKVGDFELNATLGMKIPSNKADITSKGDKFPESAGLVMPMYQQVSLGSVDVIFGASLINERWLLAIGYQDALTANNNTFAWSDWTPFYPADDYVRSYDLATKLKRGSDIMLRLERNFRFARYNLNVGLLPIYRITKDQTFNKTTGDYEKLDGTTGLAASLLVGGGYNFNINNSLKITFGQKLTQREVNPDGLTRHNVLIVAYLFRF